MVIGSKKVPVFSHDVVPFHMLIQFQSGKPLYQQVFEALRQAILNAELKPGEKLSSSRKLANELGVSRNIILLAYDQLLAEGYLSSQQGSGTYVSRDLPNSIPKKQQKAQPGKMPPASLSAQAHRAMTLKPGSPHPSMTFPRFDFRYGLISEDKTMLRHWKRCLSKAAQSQPLNYDEPSGNLALRQTLAQYMNHNRGLNCQSRQIVITSGSQQALYLISQTLLEKNDKVVIEEPHYQGARKIFLAQGARLLAAPVDDEGMQVTDSPARLAYVTPSHQFPLGPIMSLGRRLELLHWAQNHQAYILEDDYDSEYRYEGRPIAAIQGLDESASVIYSGTFSKTLFPSLRLGFLVLPEQLIEAVRALKWLIDRHSSSLDQLALNYFIHDGHFARHLRRKRLENAQRRTVLLKALKEAFGEEISIVGSNAGVHLVAWFKHLKAQQATGIMQVALEHEVGIYDIAPYYLKSPEKLGLVFGYGYLNEREIQEGIGRFKAALKAYAAS